MVIITYYREAFRLTASGHAGAGEYGKDPVCAAVSALVLTLGSNVADLCLQENAEKPVLFTAPGAAEISCTPKKGMEQVVTLMFDTVCQGFALLQRLHPQSVRFQLIVDS